MKNTILAALLLTAGISTAQADEWVYLTTATDGTMSYFNTDYTAMTVYENGMGVWGKIVNVDGSYVIIHRVINCTDRTTAITGFHKYRTDGSVKYSHEIKPVAWDFETVIPGSVLSVQYKLVCDPFNADKKPTKPAKKVRG